MEQAPSDDRQQLPLGPLSRVALSDIPEIRQAIGLDSGQRRVAVPPNLLGPLSPKGAKWLGEQQQIAKDHYRKVSAALGKLGRAR